MEPVTEVWLLSQGVRFDHKGARVFPSGPRERLDLRDALREEVMHRARRMLALVPQTGWIPPLVIADTPPPPRSGLCMLCGDPLTGFMSGGQCSLCTLALEKALVMAGGLPAFE